MICQRTKKVCFEDRISAELKIAEIKNRTLSGPEYTIPIRCYRCPSCGWWHLTSMHEKPKKIGLNDLERK